MSKAKDRAKERYWLEPSNIETQEKYAAYVEGYHQAEKDLELTWEDISVIRQIMFDYHKILREQKPIHIPSDKDYCQEVLKRFKEKKGE